MKRYSDYSVEEVNFVCNVVEYLSTGHSVGKSSALGTPQSQIEIFSHHTNHGISGFLGSALGTPQSQIEILDFVSDKELPVFLFRIKNEDRTKTIVVATPCNLTKDRLIKLLGIAARLRASNSLVLFQDPTS